MKRCKYCGKQIEDSFEFCKSKCKENYKKAGECDSRKMKYFISGMAFGFLVLFCGVCAGSNTIWGQGLSLWALRLFYCPLQHRKQMRCWDIKEQEQQGEH